MSNIALKLKLDEAFQKIAPNGQRPPPQTTIAVELSYGDLVLIASALALRDAVRDAVK